MSICINYTQAENGCIFTSSFLKEKKESVNEIKCWGWNAQVEITMLQKTTRGKAINSKNEKEKKDQEQEQEQEGNPSKLSALNVYAICVDLLSAIFFATHAQRAAPTPEPSFASPSRSFLFTSATSGNNSRRPCSILCSKDG